jgi:hypothetical protein
MFVSLLRSVTITVNTTRMPSRASRGGKRADFIQNALREVEQVTGDILKPAEGKNIFAQALSALGASKGGKARAASLSKKKRADIARKAARARWKAK